MYEQIREDILFIILYSVVTGMDLMAACYLLFRRGNAFAPDITTPARLRHWTAAFFVFLTLNHIWYMPLFFLNSSEDILMAELIGGMLDSMTVLPLSIVILFAMLQDRRRPLWPIAVMTAPLVLGMATSIAIRSDALYPVIYAYVLMLAIALITYMVREVRKYGHWLHDNFADLEHKEVWQSFIVLGILLLVFVFYEFCNDGLVYLYFMEVFCIVLICYLLWRVETLSDLSIPISDAEEADDTEKIEDNEPSLSTISTIGPLLKQYCEEPQLYLQYDLSIVQLAKLIGTNRSYLSKYFASKGITYNAYINGLRIQHFINLYREAVAKRQPVTVQQLAHQSGFRNYNTFGDAFKRMMGMTATEWKHNFSE